MTRSSSGPLQILVIGLLVLTGLATATPIAAASPIAAATPMAGFIDCSDSFWQVACHNDFEPADEPGVVVNEANAEPADEPDVVVGELIRIDNDPVCTELDSGYIICHS